MIHTSEKLDARFFLTENRVKINVMDLHIELVAFRENWKE